MGWWRTTQNHQENRSYIKEDKEMSKYTRVKIKINNALQAFFVKPSAIILLMLLIILMEIVSGVYCHV